MGHAQRAWCTQNACIAQVPAGLPVLLPMQDKARRFCQQMVLEALASDEVAAYMCKV